MVDRKLVVFSGGVRCSRRGIFQEEGSGLLAIMRRESTTSTRVPGWDKLLPWLRAGTTRREREASRPSETRGPEEALDSRTTGRANDDCRTPLGDGWRSVVRSLQVHGAVTRMHTELPAGESVVGEGDGHLTRRPGVLLTVTLADCVPVFIADPVQRAIALLHAGWRGTAAGVLGQGLAAMGRAFGSVPGDLFVHLGPAICGRCYEVGPEVFEALGEAVPPRPAPIDLRGVIRQRALVAGVDPGHLTANTECTLCGDGRYYSHRRGDTGRHRGFIGILPKSGRPGRDVAAS